MSTALGTVADLPAEYYNGLVSRNLLPLWPALRSVLPYGKPSRRTRPTLWKYADVRPNLLRAGELAPIEKAERRVLVLCNPGLGLENMQATPSIYIGMQLILPGETAPTHRHTPMAVRFVVEGKGGYTLVQGEKLPMDRGDLILTPPKLWHEHGHEGTGPVIWLDALDLPLVYYLEASYAIEGAPQPIDDPNNGSTMRFRQGGVVPYESLDRTRAEYPLLRFPWRDVRQTLSELASITPQDRSVHLAYVNPETGRECMNTLGFSALMLRPGEVLRLPKRSASSVFHAVEGQGTATVDGIDMAFVECDTFAAPTHAEIRIANGSSKSPACVFIVDDAPLQRRLGFYEVFE